MTRCSWVRLGLLLVACSLPAAARADGQDRPGHTPPPYATFALIVGVNRSVDADATLLRFRSLGARSYVLSRLDSNTRRLHPQVAAEALLPVRSELDRSIGALAADVQQARQRGVKTVLYFVYAGHGNVKDGKGYLALENARLDARELEAQVFGRVRADQTHLIVDACYSYFLTLERGPGGARRELHGFSMAGLTSRDSVGLLLSTSSARESHEWSGFEAGVFSHEVRSGLYGAADVDGDGRVSYREIAAFLHRANLAIPNERYRPDVFAHPPRGSDVLLDLREGARARIEVPATLGGRYFLEDDRGIRVADLHNGGQQAAYLLKPANGGRLYLRRVGHGGDATEYAIPSGVTPVSLAALTPQEPRSGTRGSANDSFERLFSLPFDQGVVESFALKPWVPPPGDSAPLPSLPRWRLYGGVGLLAAAAVSGVAAAASSLSARQQAVSGAAREQRWPIVGFSAAGVFGAAGLALLLWPERAHQR
jgi:hypothetical protein